MTEKFELNETIETAALKGVVATLKGVVATLKTTISAQGDAIEIQKGVIEENNKEFAKLRHSALDLAGKHVGLEIERDSMRKALQSIVNRNEPGPGAAVCVTTTMLATIAKGELAKWKSQ